MYLIEYDRVKNIKIAIYIYIYIFIYGCEKLTIKRIGAQGEKFKKKNIKIIHYLVARGVPVCQIHAGIKKKIRKNNLFSKNCFFSLFNRFLGPGTFKIEFSIKKYPRGLIQTSGSWNVHNCSTNSLYVYKKSCCNIN